MSSKQYSSELIPTGRKIGNFLINFEITATTNSNFRMNIQVPVGYPDTALIRRIIAERKRYVLVHDYKKPINFGYIEMYLSKTTNKLANFYVQAQVHSDIATKQEKQAFKGMGRVMMCTAIHICISRSFLQYNSLLILEPYPYRYIVDYSAFNINEYLEYAKTNGIEYYTRDKMMSIMDMQDSKQKKIDLAEFKSELIDEVHTHRWLPKLKRYYSTLGFHMEPDGYFMSGTVKDLVAKCQTRGTSSENARSVFAAYDSANNKVRPRQDDPSRWGGNLCRKTPLNK